VRTTQLKIGSAAVAGAMLACLPGSAHATLGGNIATITVNQQHFSAKRAVQPMINGQRHDLTLASGTIVHEYLSAKGAVYAVTWRGPRKPDLTELLGGYFAQLVTPPKAPRRGSHHHLAINGQDLVVQASGHNNFYSGRAWVPSLVPAGVDASLAVQVGQ
jgi:Protein of unknown function (DUF2844)